MDKLNALKAANPNFTANLNAGKDFAKGQAIDTAINTINALKGTEMYQKAKTAICGSAGGRRRSRRRSTRKTHGGKRRKSRKSRKSRRSRKSRSTQDGGRRRRRSTRK
jgi:hypothetical protein